MSLAPLGTLLCLRDGVVLPWQGPGLMRGGETLPPGYLAWPSGRWQAEAWDRGFIGPEVMWWVGRATGVGCQTLKLGSASRQEWGPAAVRRG